jgi:hypothetical protein
MGAGPSSLECPRCSGSMETGFTIDVGYGTKAVPKWAPGEPNKSIWTGLKVKPAEQREVTTFRCRRCGYLESYA